MNRQSVLTVESSMLERPISINSLVRANTQRQREIAHVARYGAAVMPHVTRQPAPMVQWSDLKLCAILQCERGECARDCVKHFFDRKIRGSQQDFAELRSEGLAFKRELAQFHELTDEGRKWAAVIVKVAAVKLDLHHVYRVDTSQATSAKCTCGFHASFERKYFGENGKLDSAINAHLADPDAWKRERQVRQARVDASVNRIAREFEARDG